MEYKKMLALVNYALGYFKLTLINAKMIGVNMTFVYVYSSQDWLFYPSTITRPIHAIEITFARFRWRLETQKLTIKKSLL